MENQITDVITLRNMLRESALLSALALEAVHGYRSDDVSKNKAYEDYGEAWMKDREERGLITVKQRSGSGPTSPIMYSRFEIETLKRTEKLIQDEYKRLSQCQK